jgi:hypothetical protein
MASKGKLEKLDKMREQLEAVRKIAADMDDLPEIGYRGVRVADLKLSAEMEAILKYLGNGCPNIYYADDWGASVINPRTHVALTERIDEMISAVEMAKIQSTIGEIAPDLVTRMMK